MAQSVEEKEKEKAFNFFNNDVGIFFRNQKSNSDTAAESSVLILVPSVKSFFVIY